MRRVAEIDILNDKPLQLQVNALALAVAAAGAVGAVLGVAAGWLDWTRLSLPWLLALIAGYGICLPVHELVHGSAFKLMAPGCRLRFGFASGFLYASAEGTVLARGRMVAVLLAPAVLVTTAVAMTAATAGWPGLAWLLATLHLSGCAGDALMAWRVLATPGCTHVRDTDTGIELLGA